MLSIQSIKAEQFCKEECVKLSVSTSAKFLEIPLRSTIILMISGSTCCLQNCTTVCSSSVWKSHKTYFIQHLSSCRSFSFRHIRKRMKLLHFICTVQLGRLRPFSIEWHIASFVRNGLQARDFVIGFGEALFLFLPCPCACPTSASDCRKMKILTVAEDCI